MSDIVVFDTYAMVPVADFLPRLQAAISGLDEDVAENYVMDAVIEFCRDSLILEAQSCVHIPDCVDSISLDFGTCLTVFQIKSVVFMAPGSCGTKVYDDVCHEVRDNVLYITQDLPEGVCEAKVDVYLVPNRDSYEVPKKIYDIHLSAITNLALSKLLLLSGQEWYNRSLSQQHRADYLQAVRQAKREKIRSYSSRTNKVKPRRWF